MDRIDSTSASAESIARPTPPSIKRCAGSHEARPEQPEDDRRADSRCDEPQARHEHALPDEVPQVHAEDEQDREGDYDRGDRRGVRVQEYERNGGEERSDEGRDAVDDCAQDRRKAESFPVFLAQPGQHGPLDRADVKLLPAPLRLVGAHRAAHREGDRGSDRGGDNGGLVGLEVSERGGTDDDPEDGERAVERANDEVATDNRPDVRNLVVFPQTAAPGAEVQVIRSRSRAFSGSAPRGGPRGGGPARGSGSSLAGNPGSPP